MGDENVGYVEWEQRWSRYLVIATVVAALLIVGLYWLATRPTDFERRCEELTRGPNSRAGFVDDHVRAEEIGCPGVFVD